MAASCPGRPVGGRRSRLAGLVLLAAAGVIFSSLLSSAAFAAGAGAGALARAPHTQVFAQSEAEAEAPSSGSSTSIVKVTEETKMTTAAVLGGALGLLLGGVWVGAAAFTATAYFARQEDSDISKALKGVAASGLEVLNFGGYVNEKYEVTGKIGSAVEGAIGEEGKKNLDKAVESVKAADKEIKIKDTIGNLATSASDLATKAVSKAVEANEEYKVTDQIASKVQEVTKSIK